MSDYPLPRALDSKPFLTLVERDYLSSMGNIPRDVWEPISLMYTEADSALDRLASLDLPPALEPVRASCLEKWGRVLRWLDEILIKSQSVNALRSWQMVHALRPDDSRQPGPVAGVVPASPSGRDGGRRGLRR